MPHDIALVLETNNLRRGADTDAARTLENLFAHLDAQSFELRGLKEIVVTHDGVSDETRHSVEAKAGRSLHWVEIPETASYYEAKNRGFAATESEVVVFADADCWPERHWLETITRPFERSFVEVVAGRTRYRDDVLGRAVSLLDFLYVERPEENGVRYTRNFYANNVAFRRNVFERWHYDTSEAFFRGHCQALGLRLDRAGVRIVFAHDAITEHRFPDTLPELVALRLYRGRDLRLLAPRLAAHAGVPVGTLPAALATWIGRQSIATSTLLRAPGSHRFAVGAAALGVALLDGAGAILGERTGASSQTTLSYQTDKDGFAARDRARVSPQWSTAA